jgi:hypothetical protein
MCCFFWLFNAGKGEREKLQEKKKVKKSSLEQLEMIQINNPAYQKNWNHQKRRLK